MKNFIIPFICAILSFACSDNKQKTKPVTSDTQPTAEDQAMKQWLLGKEWHAENDNAPFHTLKMFSIDSVDYVTGKDPWNMKKGEFTIGRYDMVTWPFKKLSDTSFTLYVNPTQKTFVYRFIKNL